MKISCITPDINIKHTYNNREKAYSAKISPYSKPADYNVCMALKNVMFCGNKNNQEQIYRQKINQLNIAAQRKQVCFDLLKIKDEDGGFHFPIEEMTEFLSSENNLTEEQINNVQKRKLLNKDLIDYDELEIFSSLSDEQWEEIKPLAYKIYKIQYLADSEDLKSKIHQYKDNKIEVNELFEEYSRTYFNSFLDKVLCYACDTDTKYYDMLYKKLNKGDVDSSNIEMLIDLVKKNILSPEVILDIQENSKVSDEVSNDLDKLYYSITENKPIEDVFIPEYTREEAIKETETGDVCRIRGEKNLHIKMQDNSLKELFISPNMYLQLFPPVERNIFIQGGRSNCFLVAALESIYENKNTRHKILEMFKENADGSLSIAIGGFKKDNDKILPDKKDAFIYTVGKKSLKNDEITFKALIYLEDFFEEYSEHNAEKNIKKHYENFKNANFENNTYTHINGLKYTSEDVKEIINQIEEYYKNPNDFNKKVVSLSDIYAQLLLIGPNNNDEIQEEASETIDEAELNRQNNDATMNEAEKILKRYEEYLDRTGKKYKYMDDIVHKDVLSFLVDSEINPQYVYTDIGGNSYVVYKQMGFKNSSKHLLRNIDTQIMLKNKEHDKNSVFSLHSINNKSDKKYKIRKMHQYSMQPIKDGNQTKYIIKDPHNSSQVMEMDLDELVKYFEVINIGE